eukprot:3715966-Rhodomonas_salina.1
MEQEAAARAAECSGMGAIRAPESRKSEREIEEFAAASLQICRGMRRREAEQDGVRSRRWLWPLRARARGGRGWEEEELARHLSGVGSAWREPTPRESAWRVNAQACPYLAVA